jgi:membrane protease YdiL (CAAX protease family)
MRLALPGGLVSAAILGLSGVRAMALHGGAPSIATGIGFAGALAALALLMPAVGPRARHLPSARVLALGAGLGIALLVPGIMLRAGGHHTPTEVLPPLLLLGWAPAVCMVAAAEEVALRAVVQPRLRAAIGPAPAIVLVAVVFALMHYPLYGAGALPLDLGVGLLIGCLREYTGSVSACMLAHAVADVGAWWLP